MYQEVKVPFSIAMSSVLSLSSVAVTSIAMLAIGVEWLSGLVALSTVLLFSIMWPSSMLAMFGRMMDDRLMSIEDVASESRGSMPVPLLRGFYVACVILLYVSLVVLLIGMWEWRVGSSTAVGIDPVGDFRQPLMGASVAGLIASLGVALIQRNKVRHLMWSSLIATLSFAMAGSWVLTFS